MQRDELTTNRTNKIKQLIMPKTTTKKGAGKGGGAEEKLRV